MKFISLIEFLKLLTLDNNEAEDVLKTLLPLRGKAASKHKAIKDREINKYFRVVLNEDHMEQYVKAGRVTQETINSISSEKYEEIIKFA